MTTTREHTLLYVGPGADSDPLGVGGFATLRPVGDGSQRYVLSGRTHRLYAAERVEDALEVLRAHPIDAVVIELREQSPAKHGGATRGRRSALDLARPIVDALFPPGDMHSELSRSRVLALVGPDAAGAERAFDLGRIGVGSVLSAPSLERLHGRLQELLTQKTGGKVAICLAGGGIEGLLYEVGVLRALDSFLVNRRIEDFDILCGISAGAVIGAFMANGLGPAEIAEAFGNGTDRVRPIRKSELFDPNLPGLARGGMRLLRQLSRGDEELAELTGVPGQGGRRSRGPLSALARSIPSGVFAGQKLGAYLREHLEKPGMTNDFRSLRRPLLIGATDMDTSEPVVFGRKPFDHVPIHQAVRASAALVPFYGPERIDGRWYTDGGFTRTTNIPVAIAAGATMVIVIDPLVPVRASTPGYVEERGGIFASMQGLKALVNGRFDKAAQSIREMYPDVSFHLFRPDADEMRILGGSPMKYFYRREIDQVAFRGTQEKIRGSYERLRLDFARHGIEFRAPASAPARQEPVAAFAHP